MELDDLNTIRAFLRDALRESFPGHAQRIEIGYPNSPNPLCFFEVEGACFAQGSFWANNEYSIEAMNNQTSTELMNESGIASNPSEAIAVVRRFCDLARASTSSPHS